MSRVALLIGVSQYPGGLPPMSHVQTDLAALERVLKSAPVNVAVEQCLLNSPLIQTEEAIEQFFNYRQPEDQAILVMAGYAFLDRRGLLNRRDQIYFATADTAPDKQGQLVKAKTIPASFILDAMNGSPAQHQVLILDICFRQSFGREVTGNERPVDLSPFLRDGRVILTASSSTHSVGAPPSLPAWSYLRYLTEGIETGAADDDGNGVVSGSDLHQYVERKLKVAAPAMDTQILAGEAAAAHCPLVTVATETPEVRFRKLLEGAIERGDVDTANCELKGRTLLNDIRTYLGLDAETGHQIELEVLRPFGEYRRRLQIYEQVMTTRQPNNLSSLALLRQSLWLTERDTAAIDARPYLAERQRQRLDYQAKLSQYEQVLLAALQHQYPLEEGDQQQLQQLKQVLGLRDEDTQAIEEQLIARIYPSSVSDSPRPIDSLLTSTPPPAMEPQPDQPVPPANFSDSMPPSFPTESEPVPTELHPTQPPHSELGASYPPGSQPGPQENQASSEYEISPTKEAVLQRLVSFNAATPANTNMYPETTLQPPPEGALPVSAAPLTEPTQFNQAAGSALPPEVLPDDLNTNSLKQSKANNLKGLIIPGMILATIGGFLAATSPFWKDQFFSQQVDPAVVTSLPVDVQTLLRQANSLMQQGRYTEAIAVYDQALQLNDNSALVHIERGVAYHRLGDLGAARRDNDRAIRLLEAAIRGNNGQTTPEMNGQMASAYNNRSHVFFDLDNFQQSEADARQAIAKDSRLLRAFTNLGNALQKQNRQNEAIQEFTRVIGQKPSDRNLLAGTLTNRGNAFQALNQPDAALKDYNQALKVDPNYAEAFFNRAIMLERQGQIAEATRDFERAAALYGNQGNATLQQQASEHANRLRQPGVPVAPSTATSPQSL